MTIKPELLETLRKRREKIKNHITPAKLKAMHDKGLLSARERIDALFDAGTFQELGMHARHNAVHFGMAERDLPADGVIAGSGYLGSTQVASFSQDFSVLAGTLGKMQARKITRIMRYAIKIGVPVVAFKDSGGARIQEGVDALSGYGDVFYANVLLSGVVPQIAVVCGPCAGGAAYSPALMDFVIMTRKNSHMFLTGPEVIKAVTGRTTTMNEIGSAEMHASVSGNVHFIAEDDQHAVLIAKKLLTFLPSNNSEDPPELDSDGNVEPNPVLDEIVPLDAKKGYDVREIIANIVDGGDFLEVQSGYATNAVVGFARIVGRSVGVVANQPMVLSGVLDINASDKIAQFVRFCNAFNIPLVTLVDVPGFMPGVQQEYGGIIRHGAKVLFAYSSATVPKVTVIIRKAYGGAYIAMCCRDLGADRVFAWPSAEIAVMGAEGAAEIVFSRDIKAAEDQDAKRAEVIEEYRSTFSTPYVAAARRLVDDVIQPADTRRVLAQALDAMHTKRELRPAKKHGLIPL